MDAVRPEHDISGPKGQTYHQYPPRRFIVPTILSLSVMPQRILQSLQYGSAALILRPGMPAEAMFQTLHCWSCACNSVALRRSQCLAAAVWLAE